MKRRVFFFLVIATVGYLLLADRRREAAPAEHASEIAAEPAVTATTLRVPAAVARGRDSLPAPGVNTRALLTKASASWPAALRAQFKAEVYDSYDRTVKLRWRLQGIPVANSDERWSVGPDGEARMEISSGLERLDVRNFPAFPKLSDAQIRRIAEDYLAESDENLVDMVGEAQGLWRPSDDLRQLRPVYEVSVRTEKNSARHAEVWLIDPVAKTVLTRARSAKHSGDGMGIVLKSDAAKGF